MYRFVLLLLSVMIVGNKKQGGENVRILGITEVLQIGST